MPFLVQSTAVTRVFQLGAPAVAPTAFQISKNGNPFSAPTSATVTSLGAGFFWVSLSTTDTNTLGDLAFDFTGGTGVTQPAVMDQVVPANIFTGLGAQLNNGTATIALKNVVVNNTTGIGVSIASSTTNAVQITGASAGVFVTGPGGLSLNGSAGNGCSITGTVGGLAVQGSSGPGVTVNGSGNDGIQVTGTAGAAMRLTGTAYGLYITTTTGPGIYTAVGSRFGMDLSTAGAGLNAVITPTPVVELAASQPLYAPAKDGDKMDLVNTPNSTALAALWSAGSLYVGGQLNNGTASVSLEGLVISNPSGSGVLVTGSTDAVQLHGTGGNGLSLIGGTNGLLIDGLTGVNVASSGAGVEIVSSASTAISATGASAACVVLVSPGEPALDYTATTGFDPAIPVSVGPVELAASQPLYAPARIGDQMDLVDSPNATALDAIAAAVFSLPNSAETGWNLTQALSILLAACAGRSTLVSATRVYRDVNNTVNRITATVDMQGQRLEVSLTPM